MVISIHHPYFHVNQPFTYRKLPMVKASMHYGLGLHNRSRSCPASLTINCPSLLCTGSRELLNCFIRQN
jgi:hypothetical protein